MKKFILVLFASFFLNSNLFANEDLTINELIKDGYKIIKQDTISSNDTIVAIMIFTLKKKNDVLVCSFKVRPTGRNTDTICNEP